MFYRMMTFFVCGFVLLGCSAQPVTQPLPTLVPTAVLPTSHATNNIAQLVLPPPETYTPLPVPHTATPAPTNPPRPTATLAPILPTFTALPVNPPIANISPTPLPTISFGSPVPQVVAPATAVPTLLPSATALPTLTTATPLPATPLPTIAFASPVPTQPPAPSATSAPPTNPPPVATPTIAPLPTSSGSGYPNLNLIPGQPQGYLSQFRLITYYGSPMGVGLGILGNQPRYQTLNLLRGTVADYEPLSDRPILPTYHMVSTVANSSPPQYRHHVPLDVLNDWVAAGRESGVAIILDIQPGRVDVMAEYYRIRYLLYEPHVHLAIDPEFVMNETQVPLQHVGQLYASQINAIQADMHNIGYEIGLNRVLILHQFKDSMLPDKENIQAYSFVELVIDGDGVGPAGPKIANYNQYATEPGFEYGGFKLFPRDGDNPLMTPYQVMNALYPPPAIIIYQ